MGEAQELVRVAEHATNGYWLPLTIVTACFSIIIILLLSIWNKREADNKNKFDKQDNLNEQLTKSSIEQKVILTELQTIVSYHEKDIQKIRNNV